MTTSARDNTEMIRYHSSDRMDGIGELAGITEPVAVVVRQDGSIDTYGYLAVIDQRRRPVIYRVDVAQTITTTVDVAADSPEDALARIDRRDFPLPPRDEWSSVKGSFEYELADDDDRVAELGGDN